MNICQTVLFFHTYLLFEGPVQDLNTFIYLSMQLVILIGSLLCVKHGYINEDRGNWES